MTKNLLVNIRYFIIIGVVLSLLNFTTAFGIGSPYNKDSPLSIPPGGVKDTYFLMQNMASDSSVMLQATLSGGSEVAQLTDGNLTYIVNSGEKDKKASVRISIPENAEYGKTYAVLLTLSQIPVEGGSLGLMPILEGKIYVVVGNWTDESGDLNTPSPAPPLSPWLQEKKRAEMLNKFSFVFIIAIVIVLALILFFSLRSRRDKKQRVRKKN